MPKSGEVQGPGGPDQPAKGRGPRNVRGGQKAPAARVRRVAPVSPVAPAAVPLPDGTAAASPIARASLLLLRGFPGMSDADALALMKAAGDELAARQEAAMDAKVARIKRQLADGTYVIDEDKLVAALFRRLREWPDG